jgi:hypothetical protein
MKRDKVANNLNCVVNVVPEFSAVHEEHDPWVDGVPCNHIDSKSCYYEVALIHNFRKSSHLTFPLFTSLFGHSF